jgi:predicted RNA-binding Zn-ribbon protein involved in translation (DUF1610 family)
MAKPGTYQGRHYTEWVDEVKRLKRENLLDEAETLLMGLINATESEAREKGWRDPAPAYYRDLAIIYRKQHRYQDEIGVLTRYMEFVGDFDGAFADRRRKAQRLQDQVDAIVNQSTACPYCETDLEQVQQRSGPCPECGEHIVVRTLRGAKLMMTKAQQAEEKHQKVRDAALGKANQAGATTEEFDAEEEALRGRLDVALPMDVFWSLANRKAIEGAAASDWAAAASAYGAMAERLVEEGKDPYGVYAKAVKYRLMTRLEYTPPDRVLFVSGCDCPPCQVEPRKLTFAEALENPPIPHVECEEKICHCHLMDDWGEGSDSQVIHIDVSVAAEGEERQKAATGNSGSGCASTMMVALGMVALLILAVLIT